MNVDDSVLVRERGAVTIVSINRPHRRNSVDGRTARRLYEEFKAFDRNSDVSVAILTGEGGTFCAGADLKAIDEANLEKRCEVGGLDTLAPMGPTRLRMSKPVIAAVEGYAVAGGMELALWADLRVMAQGAHFGIFCRRFGVPLVDLGTIRLPRLIGQARAMDLILTGREVGAREAFDIGLANRLTPDGEALEQAIALAENIAAFPQNCLRQDRLSVLQQWDLDEDGAIENEVRGGLRVIEIGESLKGAASFVSGMGRHGAFERE
jgi:enoyl-CoA hydratase